MKISHCGFIAPVIHHLRPLRTYSSPSRTIEVSMLVASDDATSGSVIANAERMLPSSSGVSQRSCCSGLPNIASTSMLPVSGAEQLSAGGARWPARPVISASGAYWRLVSPAPCSSPGRNRFQSPRSRASARSSWSTGAVDHANGSSIASSWSWKTCSAGSILAAMKSSSCSCSSWVRASSAKSMRQFSFREWRPAAMIRSKPSPIRSNPSPTVWPLR